MAVGAAGVERFEELELVSERDELVLLVIERAAQKVAELRDAFLGANVICHIPYIQSLMSGVKLLLKPKGVMVFEDPYLGDIIEGHFCEGAK